MLDNVIGAPARHRGSPAGGAKSSAKNASKARSDAN
jgi:hypothetical protein